MRLELALIVGILFFCSWCAYIVARMNASVGGSGGGLLQETSASLAPQSDWANASAVAPPVGEYQLSVNRSQGESQASQQQQQQHQVHPNNPSLVTSYNRHLFEASEPRARYHHQYQQQPTHQSYQTAAWPSHMDQHKQQQQPQTGPPYASATALASQAPNNYQIGNELQQPLIQQQQPGQWQAYALPTSSAANRQHASQNFGPAPELMDANQQQQQPDVNNDLADYDTAEDAVSDYAVQPRDTSDQLDDATLAGGGGGGVDDDDDASDASGSEEQPLAGEDDEADESGANDESSSEAEMPPAKSELEQVAQRRSFSEQDSNSSERDKDGRLVVTKRRHLINGKPVPRQSFQRALGSRAAPSGEEWPAASQGEPEQADDFESLVNEIDQEDRLRKRTGPLAPSGDGQEEQNNERQASRRQARDEIRPASSRMSRVIPQSRQLISSTNSAQNQVNKRVWPNSSGVNTPTGFDGANKTEIKSNKRVGGADEAKGKMKRGRKKADPKFKVKNEKRPGNLNEHRLKETLTQQQWDDDSASSINERPAECNTNEAKAECSQVGDEDLDGGEHDHEQVSDVVDRDEEARRLEGMAHELLLDPKFAELTRRRRQAPVEATPADESGANPTAGHVIDTQAGKEADENQNDESESTDNDDVDDNSSSGGAEEPEGVNTINGGIVFDETTTGALEETRAGDGEDNERNDGGRQTPAKDDNDDNGEEEVEADKQRIGLSVGQDNLITANGSQQLRAPTSLGREFFQNETAPKKWATATNETMRASSDKSGEASESGSSGSSLLRPSLSSKRLELSSSQLGETRPEQPQDDGQGQFDYRENEAAERKEFRLRRHQEPETANATKQLQSQPLQQQQQKVVVTADDGQRRQQEEGGRIKLGDSQRPVQRYVISSSNLATENNLRGQIDSHNSLFEQQEPAPMVIGSVIGSASGLAPAAGAPTEAATSISLARQDPVPRVEVAGNNTFYVPVARSQAQQLPLAMQLPMQPHSAPEEIVSGQEDMHVEILARPAAQNNFPTIGPIPQTDTNYSLLPPTRQAPAGRPVDGGLQHFGPQQGGGVFPRISSPFASGSSKVADKKKFKRLEKKRSKLINSKYKSARAYANKRKSKQKQGQMRKKKRKLEKKLIAGKKHFVGATRGKKLAKGRAVKGANKGTKYYKDKGYKKRGFKKAYHKLETGDHKTYFDEFRDKDHNDKWKKYDDKHKYSSSKKWAGNDMKHLKHHDLKEARGKASKSGRWSEKAKSEHMKKKALKYKKGKKVASKSVSMSGKKRKKKKKKKD